MKFGSLLISLNASITISLWRIALFCEFRITRKMLMMNTSISFLMKMRNLFTSGVKMCSDTSTTSMLFEMKFCSKFCSRYLRTRYTYALYLLKSSPMFSIAALIAVSAISLWLSSYASHAPPAPTGSSGSSVLAIEHSLRNTR